jgi:hypothetical protein
MVSSALKACREMQYFPPATSKQTRPRSLAQHAGDLASDMSDLADDPRAPLTLRQAVQAGDNFAMILNENL